MLQPAPYHGQAETLEVKVLMESSLMLDLLEHARQQAL